MSDLEQVLNAVYAEARADREAHQARIVDELAAIAADLTTLLPPDMRAAGLRLVYDTDEVKVTAR